MRETDGMDESKNYIADFYEGQVSNMEIHDLLVLEELGLDEKDISKQLNIPVSFVNQLMYEHRKDF